MAGTITITTPPNTTVVLPPSAALARAVGETVAITVNNQSGSTIGLSSAGTPTKFTIDDLPATIANNVEDQIVLSLLAAGQLDFEFDGDTEVVTFDLIYYYGQAASEHIGGAAAASQHLGGAVAASEHLGGAVATQQSEPSV